MIDSESTEESTAKSIEDLEAALQYGQGRVLVYVLGETRSGGAKGDLDLPSVEPLRFSSDLHCPDCDIDFRDPVPSLFSFNSPQGMCPECNGIGTQLTMDQDKLVPDKSLSIRQGAVVPLRNYFNKMCQRLITFHIIDADAALDRHRQALAAHGGDTFGNPRGLGHQAGTETPGLHPVTGATHVQIDLVETRLCPPVRAARQLIGVTAAQLQGQRPLGGVVTQQTIPIAMDQGRRGHHLRVQPYMTRYQAHEIAAVTVGPFHHGCDRHRILACRHRNILLKLRSTGEI